MKKALESALLVAFFTLSFGAKAYSQASLQGSIVDPSGFYSTAGLTITATGRATGNHYQTTSDASGTFAFANIEPDAYILVAQRQGLERIIAAVRVGSGKVATIEMLAFGLRPTGNLAIDKHIKSSLLQGGRYPAGNISYLNISDELDLYFMIVYFGILGVLSLYGIYRYRIVYLFLRYRKYSRQPKARFPSDSLPRVTVQLPLFNEMYVAERLIDAVVRLDYPRALLEIQVLDDSTDETRLIASRAVKKYAGEGFDISYYHRDERTGFKAGALEAGLKRSSGEFILIFDADFVPRPDCIRRMIDYFTDERVGMVQMRWSHINADCSLLTKVQAIMLDAHFVIEQTARDRCGSFFNFNGTAGMWRREAIEWSGGWQHDTLAEDTDLSYRAQMLGWRFVYLVDSDVPAELPVEMSGFKSQQHRWAKGVTQVGKKLLRRIWSDPRLPLRVKLEQFFRLTGNLAAPMVIVLALINFPILIVRYNQGFFHLFVFDVPILTLSTFSVVAYYLVAQWHLYPNCWWRSIKYIPLVMAMGIALSFSNARAALEALIGVKTPFVRTPKYGIENNRDTSWMKKRYMARRLAVPALEFLFAIYFAFTIWYAIRSQIYGTLPFLMIYLLGYSYAAVMSVSQARMSRWSRRQR
jgi:cellulose synthase/poly-beta-1,6-N-acetylglucosamine synthase-like glycosyltransferase